MEVGNININFSVFSDDTRFLHVADLSDWVYAENLPSYISITPPGYKNAKTFFFVKNKINSFNSHNLGISCLTANCKKEEYLEIPDGIYTICLKSNFKNIEEYKFYLKTDRFEIEYAKVMVRDGIDFDKNFILYMTEVKFMLDVAKSHASLGNFVKAHRFFEEAKLLLKKYVECKDCI